MFYFFIIAGIILRLVPHMPNFAPIAALALFGGVYLNKKQALIIPLVAMLISDIFIGFYSSRIMLSVYGSFLIIGLLGIYLKKHKSVVNIAVASLTASILFFVITNFSMWAIPHSMYAHTWQGLLTCYTMALPFFRNTLMGDLFYVGSMFGLYELVIYIVNKYPIRKVGYARIQRERV